MKKILALLVAAAFVTPAFSADEPAKPETKMVCVDVQGKDGKPVMDPKTKQPKQQCTKVRVHKKFEGTKVPDAKKK